MRQETWDKAWAACAMLLVMQVLIIAALEMHWADCRGAAIREMDRKCLQCDANSWMVLADRENGLIGIYDGDRREGHIWVGSGYGTQDSPEWMAGMEDGVFPVLIYGGGGG